MKSLFYNSNTRTLISGAMLSALLFAAGTANAESLSTERKIAPSIPLPEVVEIATKAADGKIVAIELDHYDESPIYVAELESRTSHTVMRIDGNNGEVLSKSEITGQSREQVHAMLEELDHQDHNDGDDHDSEGHGGDHGDGHDKEGH